MAKGDMIWEELFVKRSPVSEQVRADSSTALE
jgi:hypothetical protein